MVRIPPFDASSLSSFEQRHLAALQRIRGRAVSGPFSVAVHVAPEVAAAIGHMGAYLNSPVSPSPVRMDRRRLTLIAVTVAAERSCAYVWSVWRVRAVGAGFSEASLSAIEAGRCPEELLPEDVSLWRLVTTLVRHPGQVCENTARALVTGLSRAEVAEIVGAVGYFVLICAPVNAFEIEPVATGSTSGSFPVLPDEVVDARSVSCDASLRTRVIRSRGRIDGVFELLAEMPDLAERAAHVGDVLGRSRHLAEVTKHLVFLIVANHLGADQVEDSERRVLESHSLNPEEIDALLRGHVVSFDPASTALLVCARSLVAPPHRITDDDFDVASSRAGIGAVAEVSLLVGFASFICAATRVVDRRADGHTSSWVL